MTNHKKFVFKVDTANTTTVASEAYRFERSRKYITEKKVHELRKSELKKERIREFIFIAAS